MKKNVSNLFHTKNYFIGSIAIKALGFVSIPFFTHYLSLSEYGLMSLYMSLIFLFSTLFSIGLLGSIKRYYFENKQDFGMFLYSNIVFLLLVDFIILLFFIYFLSNISLFLNIFEKVLIYTIIISFLSVFIKIYLDLLQVREESISNVVFEFIKTFFTLLLAIVFILMMIDDKYFGKIYADLIIAIIFFIYSMYKLLSVSEYKFSFFHIKYSLLFGLPVLPSMLASFALTFSDRLMINAYYDSSATGVYSLAVHVAMIVQVVILAISKSWQPIFYKLMNDKKYNVLNELFYTNTKLVLISALAIILFSKEFILLLANKEYLEANNIVILLVIGFNFFYLYTVYGQYTSYVKKTYYNSIFMIIAAGTNIILNYYLIPSYGYQVSAITTMISYIIMFLLFYYNAKNKLKLEVINLEISFRMHVLYIINIFVFLFINSISLNVYILIISKVLLIMLFGMMLFKKIIFKKLKLIINNK